MSTDFQTRCVDVLRDFVPGFVEQLDATPGLHRLVLATLETPQACAHLEAAARRWAETRRGHPTWRQLQDLQDDMEHERKQTAALHRPSGDLTPAGDVLARTVGRIPSPRDPEADHAWAQMHIRLVLDGVAHARHWAEQLRRYDALAAYPGLAAHCQDACQRLVAGAQREVARA
jgi:hypothetical protein